MTLQVILMGLLFAICEISALDWARRGDYSEAIAFGAFGVGDLAFAVGLYMNSKVVI